MNDCKFDILIPTYKPDERFGELLSMLNKQSLKAQRIIIVNTDEALWNRSFESENTEVHHIAKNEFAHGATRNLAVSFSHSDYFVFMTQDALPCDNQLLEKLLDGMKGEKVRMSYARQIAREDAGDIEKITREFNYPSVSVIKTRKDIEIMGVKAFFASNVCCAYERKTFDELGGFVDKTDFNEDMMYASKLIRNGFAVSYTADAKVFHSHNYSFIQQFKRNREIAVSQKAHPEYFGDVRSEGEGIRLVKETAAKLCRQGKWYRIPELIWISGWKYLGYLAGK